MLIVITWGYNGQEDVIGAFERLGNDVIRIDVDESGDITGNAEVACHLRRMIERCKAKDETVIVFSHNYFPFASAVCEECKVPYISLVHDSPHYTLSSPTVNNAVNGVYIFDRGFKEELESQGLGRPRHSILSVSPEMAERAAAYSSYPYEHEISFVGSLYRDQYIFFDRIGELPSALSEYLDIAINAQSKIFGVDIFGDTKTVPDSIIDALNCHVNFELTPDYRMDPRELIRDMLRKKVTSIERHDILASLGARFDVDLFTTPGVDAPQGVKDLGYADYESVMPHVFNRSKINVNITLRTIRTGIPQRALDIMACGGFLLSDYREEMAEFFTEGVDLVLARTPEDFVALSEYYLTHDDERERIAQNGRHKVLENYTHDKVFSRLLEEDMRYGNLRQSRQ